MSNILTDQQLKELQDPEGYEQFFTELNKQVACTGFITVIDNHIKELSKRRGRKRVTKRVYRLRNKVKR